MTDTEQGHQVFHTTLPTYIPNWIPSWMLEDLRGVIQAGIEGVVTLDAFAAQGASKVQSIQIKNLGFPTVGPIDVIPYWHYNIEWDVDVVTDIDWVPNNVMVAVLVVGGIAAVILSFLVGGPIAALLVAAGIVLLIAGGLLSIVETVHETLGSFDVWKFLTNPATLLIGGALIGGYFIYTSSGRGAVRTGAGYAYRGAKSGARRAAPYAKKGARRAGDWAKATFQF